MRKLGELTGDVDMTVDGEKSDEINKWASWKGKI
jgi:hypothetical protein